MFGFLRKKDRYVFLVVTFVNNRFYNIAGVFSKYDYAVTYMQSLPKGVECELTPYIVDYARNHNPRYGVTYENEQLRDHTDHAPILP